MSLPEFVDRHNVHFFAARKLNPSFYINGCDPDGRVFTPSSLHLLKQQENALRRADADYCVPVAEIPALLARLVGSGRTMKAPKRSAKQCEAADVNEGVGEREPSGLTCPDCGGVVAQIESGGNVQFRCHVGHNFSLQSFTEAQSDALERALWIVLRQLNEQRLVESNLARSSGNDRSRQKRFQENAAAAERDMKLLHQILARL